MYISTLAKRKSKIVSCVSLSLLSLWLFIAFHNFSYVAERFDQSKNGACIFYERVSGIEEARKLGSSQSKKPIDPDHPLVLKVLCTFKPKKINWFFKNSSYERPIAGIGNRCRLKKTNKVCSESMEIIGCTWKKVINTISKKLLRK